MCYIVGGAEGGDLNGERRDVRPRDTPEYPKACIF